MEGRRLFGGALMVCGVLLGLAVAGPLGDLLGELSMPVVVIAVGLGVTGWAARQEQRMLGGSE